MLFYVFGFLNYRNDCVGYENGIPARYEVNKSNYDNMWKTFREMAQVPTMYVEDMKKLWDGAISGRYGEGGSKAMFQFIQEHNPQLDAAVYTKLQTAIEAGRRSFAADQKQLADMKRAYQNLLGGTSGLLYNGFLHYPNIKLDDYKLVTSDTTEKVFAAGKADEIQLR